MSMGTFSCKIHSRLACVCAALTMQQVTVPHPIMYLIKAFKCIAHRQVLYLFNPLSPEHVDNKLP